ncbi:MAG: hypothetical protein V3V02_10750 [Rhizobiaceae bacterium]
MTKTQPKTLPDKKLKRSGMTGIAIGVLALLVCELPIILAVIGFGGLSAGALAFRPPPIVELIAVILFILGVLVLLTPMVRRKLKQLKTR